MEALFQHSANTRLHFGLRDQLTKMVKKELARTVTLIYETTLSTHMTDHILNEHLWIKETKGTIKEGLEKETLKVLWESILEAISAGLGNIAPGLAGQLAGPDLKSSLLGRNAAQFSAVWNAALHGDLQGAKGAGQDFAGLSHAEAFDRA